MAIRSLGSYDYFELRAAKRGKRLHWTEEDFATPSYPRIIAHSPAGICWREVSKEEYEAACRSEDTASARFKRAMPTLDEFKSRSRRTRPTRPPLLWGTSCEDEFAKNK